jgi:hypothetical protein
MKYRKIVYSELEELKQNSAPENFFFHSTILLYKIFLIKEKFTILKLKRFLNFISKKVQNIVINRLIKNNLLVFCYDKNLDFIMNIGFQEFFSRKIYQKYLIFPQLKFFQLLKKKKNVSKKKKSLFDVNLRKKKSVLMFLNGISNNNEIRPGLQLVLLLNLLGIIDVLNHSKSQKISRKGLFLLLQNFHQQIISIFVILRDKNLYFSTSQNFLFRNFTQIFRSRNNPKKKKVCWKKKIFFQDFFSNIKNNRKLKPNLFHTFPEKFGESFSIFDSLEILFAPCFIDKIFYSLPFFLEKDKSERKKNIRNKKLQIIIESNFRIYAYFKSVHKNDILLIFCDLFYDLPNFFVGEITEKSIARSLKNGISCKNIIGFINENLHWICSSIPSSVLNQIRLWEFHSMRIRVKECYFIQNKNKKNLEKNFEIHKWPMKKNFCKSPNNFFIVEHLV